jgi:hypothetical protein
MAKVEISKEEIDKIRDKRLKIVDSDKIVKK